MRTSMTAAASAFAGVSALTLSTMAFAATNDPPSHRDLYVITTDGPFVDMDLADPGFGPGDQFAYLNQLSRDGKPLGQQAGQCTVMPTLTEDAPALFHCFDTLELPDGTITVATLAHEGGTPPFFGAITGGTGSYRSARGQVRVTFPDGTKRLDIELF